MGKKVIRLTKSELKEMILESVNEILNETDMVAPVLVDNILFKTEQSVDNGEYFKTINGKKVHPKPHNNKARILRNRLLTHYILQEIGEVQFTFLKYDRGIGRNVAVTFDMSEVSECKDSGFKLRGILRLPTNHKMIDKNADVTYDFETKRFHCLTYENGNRKKDELILPIRGELNLSNVSLYNRLILLIEDFLNACQICINELGKETSLKEFAKKLTKKMNEKYSKIINRQEKSILSK